MSSAKLIVIGLWVLAFGWSVFAWGYYWQFSFGTGQGTNNAIIPAAINDGQAQQIAQQASCPALPTLSFYPGGGDSGAPASTDFKFDIFYLGATRAEVQAACENAGGQIDGIWPNSIVNPPGFPVCYFQNGDTYTDGYYPVYWPAQ